MSTLRHVHARSHKNLLAFVRVQCYGIFHRREETLEIEFIRNMLVFLSRLGAHTPEKKNINITSSFSSAALFHTQANTSGLRTLHTSVRK